MNIHFTDSNLFNQLMNASLFQVEVGSTMYGLQTDESDRDILVIYAEGRVNQKSFLWEHHQLQYKSDGVDYIFTTLPLFIRNWMSGDSTINFEVLHCRELLGSDEMGFLTYDTSNYDTYNVLKSYLGLANRDLGPLKGRTKWTKGLYKKATHFIRGVQSAYQ